MQRGKDLIIENDILELHVFYSDNPSIQLSSDKVLLEASEAARTSAWSREKKLVATGFTGYGDWTSTQLSELLANKRKNSVGIRGYEAVEIQPHQRYPHLIRDESNYGFVSETNSFQRRRKNRHGKSRKYA